MSFFFLWLLSRFMVVYSQWPSEIMISLGSVSNTESKNMYGPLWLSYYSEKEYTFDTNCSTIGRQGFKYHNCLHELCVTTAAAATADCVNKWIKSARQTTITNLLTSRTTACTCHVTQYCCLTSLPLQHPFNSHSPHSLKTSDRAMRQSSLQPRLV